MRDLLEEYFDSTINEVETNQLESEGYIHIYEDVYFDLVHEYAEYRFMPRLRRNPDLKKLYKDCEMAEDILNSQGRDVDKRDLYKIGDLILRIYRTMDEASCIVLLPFNLTIVYIPVYLFCRLIVYVERLGEDAIGKSYARKAKASLLKLKHDSNDKKVQDKCDEAIARIDKAIEELESRPSN
jgi:hypothetical protein